MACDSACCAPPKALPVVIRTPTLPVLNIEEGSSAIPCKEEEKSCRPNLNAVGDKCHTGSARGSLKKDDCCSSKPSSVESQDLDPTSCCEGKQSPCYNSSCIDRLALRACASQGK